MAVNLKGRSFLSLADFTPEELRYLLDLGHDLKAKRRAGVCAPTMQGKHIVLLFEKTSTRTRCSFEVAAHDLGMQVTYLDPSGSQIGKKESIADTARVLGRMFDGIEYRGYDQKVVEGLAANAGVPVWNGLTTEWHPTQMLADILTVQENFNYDIKGKTLVFMGDCKNNVARSLMVVCSKLGMNFVACGPEECMPADDVIEACKPIAEANGCTIKLTTDVKDGVTGADVIYTDVWVSMGEPKEAWAERVSLMKPYQINADVMKATGNPNVKFMHCLPAHRGEEVTADVIDGPQSVVWDEAENRLHAQKAIMEYCLLGRVE